MKTAMVATGTVADVSTLECTLNKLQFGDPSYYLLQRPNYITDWKEGIPDTVEIEKYTCGRLFGKEGESRWKKNVNGYSLLWLSERDEEKDLLNHFTPLDGKWKTSVQQKTFLLGGGDTEPWRDTRIPRKLKYPMKWCPSPQVKVIQYWDFQSQIIQFTRYSEFVK